MVAAIEAVAMKLGNTPAVCRKCYVHPTILDSYMDGSLVRNLRRKIESTNEGAGLPADEAAVLRLLESRLARQAAA